LCVFSYNNLMNALTKFWLKIRKKTGSPKLLCDTCINDYHTACTNPARPNATECPDYEKR